MIENQEHPGIRETVEPVADPKDEVSTDSLRDSVPLEKNWVTDFKRWTADELRALLSARPVTPSVPSDTKELDQHSTDQPY